MIISVKKHSNMLIKSVQNQSTSREICPKKFPRNLFFGVVSPENFHKVCEFSCESVSENPAKFNFHPNLSEALYNGDMSMWNMLGSKNGKDLQ